MMMSSFDLLLIVEERLVAQEWRRKMMGEDMVAVPGMMVI